MSSAFDLQTMMMTLQAFWSAKGCLIWQPYHTEVGAGTMNPGTFLRVLGPEPWNVAYVEPSIRPDDGRYGENPNRMQQHYQFQVILKPDPGNPQELYLQSLEALGIDLKKHDIRFVEDNWMQPAMGAWGLGWQVWLDGQEITQFTYFQQAGGLNLDPVSVEITYGLERIAMPLQGVADFKDIRWNNDFSYGDINLQAEQEHSKYYFEVADVERLREAYGIYETEARNALEAGLVLPAHDYILKCSHAFNVLDTRGAVGVTERQAFFGRLRDLARRVSLAYLEQREGLEYPFLDQDLKARIDSGVQAAAESEQVETVSADGGPTKPADFLLEVGTEELPPADLYAALAQLDERLPALLDEMRLDYEGFHVTGTPRRLLVQVKNLAARQQDLEEKVKGPPADRAFDEEGFPTKAGIGFARSKGVDVESLEVEELDGGQYVVAIARQAGRPAGEVLAEGLPDLVGGLQFEKSMRWNSTNVAFSRPIRWLLALHGSHPVRFSYAGLTSGRRTRGLRVVAPPEFEVDSPEAYQAAMADQGIQLDVATRRQQIWGAMQELAHEVGGTVPEDPSLLATVINEVEAPRVIRGTFDDSFLDLPREVLIAVMKKHQNYFPVEKGGALLPYFLTVINGGGQDLELVAQGNADVIKARFADGAFFIQEDMKQPLEAYRSQLETLAFQKDLGSMLDKTRRIEEMAAWLAEHLELEETEEVTARRAASLCKADLVTSMVIEMTSLQGIMGRYYALDSGEPPAVAQAIEEHYLPRFAGDEAPPSQAGLVVGLADRLDSLVGLFAAGLAPTGAKDPFAQRRAALGLVTNLLAWNLDFDLRPAIHRAAALLPIESPPESQGATLDFIVGRLRNLLLEDGYRFDVVEAVLAGQGYNPASALRAVQSLAAWVEKEDWGTTLPAYARCARITRDLEEVNPVDPGRFEQEAEEELFTALEKAELGDRRPGSVDDFLKAFLPLIPAINRYFDDVLVMVDDQRLRQNRLGLLQRIVALADGVVDMSRLEGF